MEYKKEEITGAHIVIGIFSFFSIALGNSYALPLTIIDSPLFSQSTNTLTFDDKQRKKLVHILTTTYSYLINISLRFLIYMVYYDL